MEAEMEAEMELSMMTEARNFWRTKCHQHQLEVMCHSEAFSALASNLDESLALIRDVMKFDSRALLETVEKEGLYCKPILDRIRESVKRKEESESRQSDESEVPRKKKRKTKKKHQPNQIAG